MTSFANGENYVIFVFSQRLIAGRLLCLVLQFLSHYFPSPKGKAVDRRPTDHHYLMSYFVFKIIPDVSCHYF